MRCHKLALFVSLLASLPAGLLLPLSIPSSSTSAVLAQTLQPGKPEADCLLQQGLQQFQRSQYRESIQSWEQALAIYRTTSDRPGKAMALGSLGIAYYSLSQYPQAMKYHQQALALFQQVGDRTGEGSALNNLGNVLFKAGNVTTAENALVAAINLWESLRAGLVDEHKVSIFEEQNLPNSARDKTDE